jgi:serine/threonine-protein kinase
MLDSIAAAPVPNVTTLTPMGTPGVMSPEQARGRWDTVGGRTDLWAPGATMFTLLTARYVHAEKTVNEQLLAPVTKPAPPIRSVVPELEAVVAQVVAKSWIEPSNSIEGSVSWLGVTPSSALE